MSFAEKLISEPQRENAGQTGYERYDYQALWGLALIFEHHNAGEDYAIAFEFHDDILLLNSSTAPSKARFYQVKTRESGHWTLTDLTKRKPKKSTPNEALPSYLGKLFHNYILFPDETVSLNFVSNAPCEFLDSSSGIHKLKSCKPEIFVKIIQHLQTEHPSATEDKASLIYFVRADLSLHDSATHIKGKLSSFISHTIGDIEYNIDSLYKAIVEECRTKSKFTGAINSFTELVRQKSITRAQVEAWLDHIRDRQQAPSWSDVNQGLTFSALEGAAIFREWKRYRAAALNPSDEALNRTRDKIRAQIKAHENSSHSVDMLLDKIYGSTESFARANMTPFIGARLKAMILYEIFCYEPTGKIQETNSQLEDKK